MLAAPLVATIAVLVLVLACFSWLAADHPTVHLHLPTWAPQMLLWTILGLAEFFMPLLSRLQRMKINAMSEIRAALMIEEDWKKESLSAGIGRLLAALAVRLASAIAAQPLVASARLIASGVPHVCLTPRILAQRPFSQPALTGCPV